MAISPPSDIVLDVVRAADPAGVEAARAALARRAGNASAVAETFSLQDSGATRTASAGSAKAGTPETFKRFEAMVLQTFIQNMLPKDGAAVYGKGMAGDMWKSLLAEKVADSHGRAWRHRHFGPCAWQSLRACRQGRSRLKPSTKAPAEAEGDGSSRPSSLRRLSRICFAGSRDSLVLDLSDSSPTTTDRG